MSTSKLPVEPLEGLPPELAELDTELAGILLDERPSFGPELRNELAREWKRPRTRARGGGWVRHAMAACVVALMGVGGR